MTFLKLALMPAAFAIALGSSGAVNAVTTWTLNYDDSISALGYGATVNSVSALTDEYKYTAESLVLFNDNDNSGGISAGDTYDDVILFRIDQLNLAGATNSDLDTFLKTAQISGVLRASGTQLTQNDYSVDTASIEFWFDSIPGGGTDALFQTPVAFNDGVLVQTGVGTGGGINSGLIPDGAINIFFQLTDILSSLDPAFGNFELFDPLADLDTIIFGTDSNNNLCTEQGGTANCSSSVPGLEAFFGVSTASYDFFFHTRSDGSATKALQVPEPASIALIGLGLLGTGFMRRRARKA